MRYNIISCIKESAERKKALTFLEAKLFFSLRRSSGFPKDVVYFASASLRSF